ncbi:MAG: hypothetical protein ACI8V2_004622 [Candidatus Latescibacterota bacterium]|jgi:hypothetical protein
MNITLSPEIERLVKQKVEGGEYKTPDAFFEYAARQAILGNNVDMNTRESVPSYDDVKDLLVEQHTLDYYARDADGKVTLDQVRRILSEVPSSLSDDIIKDRG